MGHERTDPPFIPIGQEDCVEITVASHNNASVEPSPILLFGSNITGALKSKFHIMQCFNVNKY